MLAALRGHGSHKGQFKGALDGGRIWWIAPNYKQIEASQIWTMLKKACKGAYENGSGSKSEVNREITFPNGGSIAVRSADGTESLRGPGLDGVIIDEAAFVSRDTWTDSIRPALMDRKGWAMLATTPNGKNWIHDLANKSGDREGWEYWHQPSWSNPLITQAELEDIRKEIGPRKFAQEVEAQFAKPEGSLWPAEYFDEHIWAERWPDKFEISAIAIDPSIGNESRDSDYSAIVFAGLAGGVLYVDADIHRRPPGVLAEHAIAAYRHWNPTRFGVESNGFQSVLCTLLDLKCQMANIPPIPVVQITNSERKGVRIQRLDPYLDQSKIKLRRTDGSEILLEQLQMFPSRDYHDDGPDALEMAIRLLSMFLAQDEMPVEERLIP